MHILEAALVSNLGHRSWTVLPGESTKRPWLRIRLPVPFAAAIAIIGIVVATLDIAT
jgi:hypothetical protein